MIRISVMAGLAFLAAAPAFAAETAQDPWISGNFWVALAIIGVLIAVIALLVVGSFGLEKRDAKLGRGGGDDEGGTAGLGLF